MGRPPANRAPDIQPQHEELQPRSGETVTVACKLPHGLVLRLFNMDDGMEAVQGGGFKTVPVARALPEVVRINGYLSDIKGSPIQMPARRPTFALTPNVPKDFFDRWLKENRDHDAVLGNLIKVHKTDTAGMAREYAAVKNGFEPIDPTTLQGGKPGTVKTFEKEA